MSGELPYSIKTSRYDSVNFLGLLEFISFYCKGDYVMIISPDFICTQGDSFRSPIYTIYVKNGEFNRAYCEYQIDMYSPYDKPEYENKDDFCESLKKMFYSVFDDHECEFRGTIEFKFNDPSGNEIKKYLLEEDTE